MGLVYVFAATGMESNPVARMIGADGGKVPGRQFKSGHFGTNRVLLFTTGMGPRRARACADAAFARSESGAQEGRDPADRPDVAVIIGLCGGLAESLPEGRLVTYTDCLSTVGAQAPLPCSSPLVRHLVDLLGSRDVAVEPVVGITSMTIGAPIKEKLRLAKTGASVVDMESYEIVARAAAAGVPAAVLRVVADPLSQPIPNFNRALKADGDFDGVPSLLVALGSPLLTARLVAANRRAMRELTRAIGIVLADDSVLAF